MQAEKFKTCTPKLSKYSVHEIKEILLSKAEELEKANQASTWGSVYERRGELHAIKEILKLLGCSL